MKLSSRHTDFSVCCKSVKKMFELWLIIFPTKQLDVRFCLIVQNDNRVQVCIYGRIFLMMREILINGTNKKTHAVFNLFCILVPFCDYFICYKYEECKN